MLLAYSLRNLSAAWRSLLWVAIAVAATVGATVASLAQFEGLWEIFHAEKRDTFAIVFQKGSMVDFDGSITQDLVRELQSAPGIALANGAPQVFPEYLQALRFPSPDPHDQGVRRVRALDPIAWQAHSAVKIVEGRMANPGERAVVIGLQTVGTANGFHVGEKIKLGHRPWDVVGVFASPGQVYESEVWVDRNAFVAADLGADPTAAFVVLNSPDALGGLSKFVDTVSKQHAEVITLPQYQERALSRGGGRRLFVTGLIGILALLITAVVSCLNAVYAQLIARSRELATLIAIGFTRTRVILMLVFETALLCVVSSIVGLVVTTVFYGGHMIRNTSFLVMYKAQMSLRVLAVGVAAALVITLLASLAAWIPIRRLNVLQSLRD